MLRNTSFRKLVVPMLLLFLTVACATTSTKVKSFSHLETADKAYSQGRWVEAERYYQKITQAAPNDFYAWFRLGNTRLQQGKLAAAIHAYESSIQRDSRQPKPRHNLGEAYMLLAMQTLQQAHELSEPQSYERQIINKKLEQLHDIIYKPVSDLRSPARGLIRY